MVGWRKGGRKRSPVELMGSELRTFRSKNKAIQGVAAWLAGSLASYFPALSQAGVPAVPAASSPASSLASSFASALSSFAGSDTLNYFIINLIGRSKLCVSHQEFFDFQGA